MLEILFKEKSFAYLIWMLLAFIIGNFRYYNHLCNGFVHPALLPMPKPKRNLVSIGRLRRVLICLCQRSCQLPGLREHRQPGRADHPNPMLKSYVLSTSFPSFCARKSIANCGAHGLEILAVAKWPCTSSSGTRHVGYIKQHIVRWGSATLYGEWWFEGEKRKAQGGDWVPLGEIGRD